MKTFSNDIIKFIGVINTSIKCNDWTATNVDVTVFEDGSQPIIGREVFSKLGFSLTLLKQVTNIDRNQCLSKKQIAFDFPGLITRIDADTVPVEDYLDDIGWVSSDRTDLLIEEAMQKAQVQRGTQQVSLQIHHAPEAKQPHTTIREVTRFEVGTEGDETLKKRSLWFMGSFGSWQHRSPHIRHNRQ